MLRQHLTAVRAAVEISDAACDGAEIGAGELVFRPGTVRAGDYRFAIGTAGSTTLVLQTILPALSLADGPSRLTLEGGTHNPLAPPFDFLARTFLPVFNRFGPHVEATLTRAGFYPAAGGQIEVNVVPTERFRPVELLTRGGEGSRRVVAHAAGLPPGVAERAFEQVDKRLRWGRAACELVEHPAERGQGFALVGEVASERHTEVFSAFGERGLRAEAVADRLVEQIRAYLTAGLPVGEHLADQLLLPMALAGGGAFRTAGLSPHARAKCDAGDVAAAVLRRRDLELARRSARVVRGLRPERRGGLAEVGQHGLPCRSARLRLVPRRLSGLDRRDGAPRPTA